MPLVTRSTTYDMHGASFESFVSPRTGSRDLCAWRTTLCPGQSGTEHTVDSEEVMLVLSGAPRLALDGVQVDAEPGSVVFVPAGSSVLLDNPGGAEAEVWVTSVPGLTATTGDGGRISPPWVQ